MKKYKIPDDEMEVLINSCKLIIENKEEEEEDEDSDYQRNSDLVVRKRHRCVTWLNEDNSKDPNYATFINELILCAKRWLKSKYNNISQNITPFTLSGDINDAYFPMPIDNKEPWYNCAEDKANDENQQIDLYKDNALFIPKYNGSWFTLEEAHYYFHRLIDKDTKNSVFKSSISHDLDDQQGNSNVLMGENKKENIKEFPDFITKLKKGEIAWDITQDRLLKLPLLSLKPRKNPRARTPDDRIPSRYERVWDYYRKRQLRMVEEINKSNGENSELIQRRPIGDELKTKKEIEELKKLDDLNRVWKIPRNCDPKFFEQKKKNIIDFNDWVQGRLKQTGKR